MSKVKIGYTNAHEKSKLRHQLRRKETMKKKVDRINNCSQYLYGNTGYFVKRTKPVGIYKTVVVPEHTEPIKRYVYVQKYDTVKEVIVKVHEVIIEGYKTIPTQKKRQKVSVEYVETPKILKRVKDDAKSHAKHYANRRVRYAKIKTFNNGSYKKLYDISGLLW